MTSTFVVAELSANHGHQIENALETVRAARRAGADAIKIQTYTPDTLTIDCDNENFRIKQGTIWDGATLYELYQKAFTPWEWHEAIRDEARAQGLVFFSTPFDATAVDFLERIGVPMYKVASFEINDIPLLEYIASKGKPMLISLGIADLGMIDEALSVVRRTGNKDITLLKCTSCYPAPPEAANLRTLANLRDTFGVKVGLSDHTMGHAVALAAVSLGAEVIEKHFILDREIGGPDASFSMQPDEFRQMVDGIRTVEKALGRVCYEPDAQILASRHFSRSLYVVRDVKRGKPFNAENVRSIRPGNGLHTRYLKEVLGRTANRDIPRGTPLNWNLIG